jgi:hypothetical protein
MFWSATYFFIVHMEHFLTPVAEMTGGTSKSRFESGLEMCEDD